LDSTANDSVMKIPLTFFQYPHELLGTIKVNVYIHQSIHYIWLYFVYDGQTQKYYTENKTDVDTDFRDLDFFILLSPGSM
jgi:hypothetical protein